MPNKMGAPQLDAYQLLNGLQKKYSAQLISDASFVEQNKFVMDMNRFVCAQTTVRAGKTTGLAYKFFRAGHKHKRLMMPYIALTRDSAKNIMWPILQEASERHNIPCEFTESDLTCTIKATESSIKLFGADTKNFIARIKGIKTPFAAIDECQDFRSHLEELVEILTARTSEYEDGQVALTGTPGAVPRGYFYDVSNGLHGFTVHKWSLFNNKYFPNAKSFVSDLQTRKKWPDNHPTLRREYFGEWVQDLEALVLHYNEAINDCSVIPILTDYIISVDIGHDDADAIAVIGWHKHLKQCYLVEEVINTQQGITDLANQIEAAIKKYNPLKVVMDTGGLGKKIAEELRKRRSIPIVAAEKTRKIEYLALLDDALRTQNFFAPKSSRFAQDTQIVVWDYDKSTSDRLVIKDEPHSDIVDAVLYGYREALHWLSESPTPKVNIGIKEQWIKHTTELMEQSLQKQIEKEEAEEKMNIFYETSSLEDELDVAKYYVNRRR